jgi:hypothetical protein
LLVFWSRALDLRDHIRCAPVVSSLPAVLQRLEPEVGKELIAGISSNKVLGCSCHLALLCSSVLSISPCLQGVGGEGQAAAWGRVGWRKGNSLLQIGVHHMAASARCHDPRMRRQPLKMSMKASVQSPRWRPSEGFQLACETLFLPSGLVPGKEMGGWRWSLCCCAGEEGLDCFYCLLFRVICSNLQDYAVFSISLGPCLQYVPPQLILMQV